MIRFKEGTYTFKDSVQITRSDITILGAGVGKTNIVVDAKNTNNATAFDIQGGNVTELKAKLEISTTKGITNVLKLDSVAGISEGTILQLQQANDRTWLDSQGNQHVPEDADPLREMLAEVIAVDKAKGTVTLATKTPYAFQAGKTTISASDKLIKNVDLGGFSIKTNLGTAKKNDFTDTQKKFLNVSTVEVTRATDVTLHDIELKDNASNGFSFSQVYGISGRNLTTEGAHNKGGANGYAFFFKHAFNNTFTDITDIDMRHSVLFGSWSAEHYNKISVRFTNRDINFHGSPDDGNVIYVAKAELEYEGNYIHGGVSPGDAKKHPNATIDANDVKFKYFIGNAAQDNIRGADGGSFLAGFGDMDELTGGNGADTLSGGIDDDTLKGNAGADTFIFARSFDADTIRDFKTSEKDKIDLSGTGVTNLSDLARRQVGSDTVLSFGGGDELVLKGVKVSGLTSSQFTFSKALTAGVTITMTGQERGATGTNASDLIQVAPGYLDDNLHIVGGAGKDALQVIKGSVIDLRKVGRLDGVDVIDMTKTPKVGSLTLNNKIAKQIDDDRDYLTVKIDGTGAKLSTTDVKDWDLVRIVGSGQLKLNSGGNYMSAADGTKLNVAGGTGDDHVKGGSGNDKILGSSGNDVIEGGSGKDVLEGGSGNDRITGGAGADILTGGSGTDRFVFKSAKDSTSSARDTINDFWRSQKDKVDLSAIDARADKSGNQSFKFIGDKAFSGTDGQLRASKSGDGTVIAGDINGDKKADFSIFVDQAVTFKDADFIL
ncbi:calcium-binding protein [Mycoplana sp. MJR14]|uniref:calcium-binding protein n=1 Tax=Mycoplana sp. MJR14 TaxID=3032583 RepID=UPI0023DC6C01|nr:calcium-binding protein [Mycoplana sp. MJR14]MDF1634407.1 calcium-binding protein [Mycoplana sp. MJR14]